MAGHPDHVCYLLVEADDLTSICTLLCEVPMKQEFDIKPVRSLTLSERGKSEILRFLSQDIAILRAIAGMIPPGQSDINPNVNTQHTLIAVWKEGKWRVPGSYRAEPPTDFVYGERGILNILCLPREPPL